MLHLFFLFFPSFLFLPDRRWHEFFSAQWKTPKKTHKFSLDGDLISFSFLFTNDSCRIINRAFDDSYQLRLNFRAKKFPSANSFDSSFLSTSGSVYLGIASLVTYFGALATEARLIRNVHGMVSACGETVLGLLRRLIEKMNSTHKTNFHHNIIQETKRKSKMFARRRLQNNWRSEKFTVSAWKWEKYYSILSAPPSLSGFQWKFETV